MWNYWCLSSWHKKTPAKWSQHLNATCRNIGGVTCVWLPPLQFVATCCNMLSAVESNLQMIKFSMQHLRMLHDFVVVWSGLCNNALPRHAHWFNFWYPTCGNMSQQGDQTCATCCTQQCCIQMLQSFSHSVQILSQQCWDMFCWSVAIVWPRLYNQDCHFFLCNSAPGLMRSSTLSVSLRNPGLLSSSVGWLTIILRVYHKPLDGCSTHLATYPPRINQSTICPVTQLLRSRRVPKM